MKPDPTTEITLLPDGRVHVHGTSRAVLEILCDLQPEDENLRNLLRHSPERLSGGCGEPQRRGSGSVAMSEEE